MSTNPPNIPNQPIIMAAASAPKKIVWAKIAIIGSLITGISIIGHFIWRKVRGLELPNLRNIIPQTPSLIPELPDFLKPDSNIPGLVKPSFLTRIYNKVKLPDTPFKVPSYDPNLTKKVTTKINKSDIKVPKFKAPTVKIPTFKTPKIKKIKTPKVKLPW